MRSLSSTELLALWDQSSPRSAGERPLLALAMAVPGVPVPELARLPIGERDRLLLELRRRTFGSRLDAVLRCPSCSAALEMTFETADVIVRRDQPVPTSLALRVGKEEVNIRLPDSLDLAAVAHCAGVDEGEQLLFDRCLEPSDRDRLAPVANRARVAIDDALASADPQADVHLAVTCPACRHEWQTIFDIASFFWKEVRAFAGQLLADVQTLASSYGWSEQDILAMSDHRRQRYMELIQG